jgi:biotin carboxylase
VRGRAGTDLVAQALELAAGLATDLHQSRPWVAHRQQAVVFRISLARRSSRTSPSSSFMRWRSVLVSPPRRPSSVSARRM